MENPMRKLLPLYCLVMLLDGCITTTRPPENVEFGNIETIRDLEGVYQNLGEGKQGATPVYLSAVIWPRTEGMIHAAVVAIEVRAVSDNTLVVRALKKDGVEKEDTFVEGK